MSVSIMKKEEFYKIVAENSNDGTLAFFTGSGFVKSLCESAMTWNELIKETAKNLEVELKDEWNYFSEPVKFSIIADGFANKNNITFEDAQLRVKDIISDLTNYSVSNCQNYTKIFLNLKPNFIVTTNYDTTLEKILCGKGISLSIEDAFIKRNDTIPIYHIHGIRTNSQSIVATRQDYVKYLRPSNYALNRLPLLFSENCVIIFGYSIHDLNVLHAIDFANNFYKINKNLNKSIFQIKYIRDNGVCKEDLYLQDGIWVLESNNIFKLFEEICKFKNDYTVQNSNDIVKKMLDGDQQLIDDYIKDNDKRNQINAVICDTNQMTQSNYPYVLNFFSSVFDTLDAESSIPYNFSAYKTKLKIILMLINDINFLTIPELILDYIIDQFVNVSRYVGYEFGKSWDAKSFWNANKFNINKEKLKTVFDIIKMKKEADTYYFCSDAINLLNEVVDKE